MNTYKKLDDGSWGAWATTGPEVGENITITTKSGAEHVRVVKSIIAVYKTGCVVSLGQNAKIQTQVKANTVSYDVLTNSKKSQKSQIEDVINEGGEGYNPYKNDYEMPRDITAQD